MHGRMGAHRLEYKYGEGSSLYASVLHMASTAACLKSCIMSLVRGQPYMAACMQLSSHGLIVLAVCPRPGSIK